MYYRIANPKTLHMIIMRDAMIEQMKKNMDMINSIEI